MFTAFILSSVQGYASLYFVSYCLVTLFLETRDQESTCPKREINNGPMNSFHQNITWQSSQCNRLTEGEWMRLFIVMKMTQIQLHQSSICVASHEDWKSEAPCLMCKLFTRLESVRSGQLVSTLLGSLAGLSLSSTYCFFVCPVS